MHRKWCRGAVGRLLLEHAIALAVFYSLRHQVQGVAPRTLISDKKGVSQEFQIGDVDPLYVLFHPRLNVGVEHFDFPQHATACGVRRHHILISSVTFRRIASSIGNNRRDRLRCQAFRLSRSSQEGEDCAGNYQPSKDSGHNVCRLTITHNKRNRSLFAS